MYRAAFCVSLCFALIATSACTQEPARVDSRGSQFFGRDGTTSPAPSNYSASRSAPVTNSRTYAKSNYKPYQPAPVYTNTPRPVMHVSQETQQTASVQSISSSDLPPPEGAKASASAAPAPTNHWTKKPRDTHEESMNNRSSNAKESRVSEVKAPSAKPQKFAAKGDTSSFMWPVNSHKVISGFGPKGAGKANDGINIASAEGEPVWAAADGEVVYSGNELSSYGNMVLIKHPGNKTTTYAHMNRITVDKYDRVKQGDIIGYVGSSGNVKAPQLHFALRNGKDPVDPKKYLSTSMASN